MAASTAPKVFISSTSADLQDYREEADKTIRQLGLSTIKMEDFSAMESGAVEACIEKVDEADIYIGIFAHRYGYVPPNHDISITEIEFNRARERKIPCLCFLIDEEMPWPPKYMEDEPGKSKLLAFKARVNSQVVRKMFRTPTDLALEVTKSLYHLRLHAALMPSSLRVIERSTEFPTLLNYIQHNSIRRARLVLHAGRTVRDMVELLLQHGTEIHMLLQHPDSCINPRLKSNVLSFIENLEYSFRMADISKLSIYLYRENAAYRAINLDDQLLILSWYVYETKLVDGVMQPHIYSRDYPRILVQSSSQEFDICKEMFDKVFDSLQGQAQPLKAYLDQN